MTNFDKCQSEYDHHIPDEELCPVCGFEASVDCICTGEECTICNKNPCVCELCLDCKTRNGCSCDEQYQAWKERDL